MNQNEWTMDATQMEKHQLLLVAKSLKFVQGGQLLLVEASKHTRSLKLTANRTAKNHIYRSSRIKRTPLQNAPRKSLSALKLESS